MIWAVDRYVDVLKEKKERETVPSFDGKRDDKYHYFETRAEAKAFLRLRADKACAEAEKELKRAIARTRKCQRKFGFESSDAREILRDDSCLPQKESHHG